jgi:thiamine biosynthesis lipoprotein
MGSVFEVLIAGQEASYARHAATAAFEELDRLYRELNRFSAMSDVSQINALRAGQSVRVGLATFECLQAAEHVWKETGGAFDVTVGRLLALWRPRDGSAADPPPEQLAAARAATGMDLLELREEDHSVTVKADGVQIDLGGIGKGYAVDQMAAILGQWSIKAALINGGGSSVAAVGAPPGRDGWRLSICDPDNEAASLAVVHLKDRAMSSSGMTDTYRHILDPRTGRPATGSDNAWVIADSGAVAEGLSTACIVLAAQEVEQYCGLHPPASVMLLRRKAGGERQVLRFGKW